MTRLICTTCSATYGDEAPDCCEQCDGRLIDSRVMRERQERIADEVDAAFSAYHAIRDGDAAIAKRAEPTYSEGAMFRRQAS